MNPYLLIDPLSQPKLAYYYRQNILRTDMWPEVPHATRRPPIDAHVISDRWIEREIIGKILVFFDDEPIEMKTPAKKKLINQHGRLELSPHTTIQTATHKYEKEIHSKFGDLVGKYDEIIISNHVMDAIRRWNPTELPPTKALELSLTLWGESTKPYADESHPVDIVFESGRSVGRISVFYGIFGIQPLFAVASTSLQSGYKQYKQIINVFTDAKSAALKAAQASIIEQKLTNLPNIIPQSEEYINNFIYNLEQKVAELLYKSSPNLNL